MYAKNFESTQIYILKTPTDFTWKDNFYIPNIANQQTPITVNHPHIQ